MRNLLERAIPVFLLLFLLMVGLFSYTSQISATDETLLPNQIVTLAIPLDFALAASATPTATRTPSPVNIGNFVWDDYDHDGRQDAGEPGLAGITVQLWNSTKTNLLAQTVTNANGNYTLVAPFPSNYRIRVLLANNMDSFAPKDQAGGDNQLDSDINPSGGNFGFTDVISLASNVISTTIMDAGIVVFRTPTPTRTPTPINIGNYVWDDIDHDGRQDAGEPGLAGVTVQLWNASKTQLLAQTVTNANGLYTVIAPLPGDYRIRVVLPGLMDAFSPKDQAGGDNQLDSDINPSGSNIGFTDSFNLASNVISTTIHDAGIVVFRTPTPTRTPTPINIGNFVWDDLNGDGQQDADEPGLGGVTVQLWNASKTQMLAQTVTGGNGIYTLVAPFPGSYRVRVLLSNANHSFAPKNQAGGNDQLDSDINPSGGDFGFTDVLELASNLISTTIVDAGVITPLVFQPVTTLVFSSDLPNIQPVASPTLGVFIQPNMCAGFRLTSPLDGLPNGVASFYWDPTAARGVTYQITVMDENRNVLATFSAADTTNLAGDISQQRIGGGFQVIIQVSALSNGQVICTDERMILRAAPDPGAPPVILIPIATALPTRPPIRGQ